MDIQYLRKGQELYLYLSGELDEHSVAALRGRTDALIDENAGLSRAVFNLAGVRFMDSTGIRNLRNFFIRTEKRGIRVILSGVNPQVLATLRKFGLDREIGTEYIFPHIIPALAKANEYLLSVRKEKRRK